MTRIRGPSRMRPRNSRTLCIAGLVLLIGLCTLRGALSYALSYAQSNAEAFEDAFDLNNAQPEAPAREEAEDEHEVDKLADVEVHQDAGSGTNSSKDLGSDHDRRITYDRYASLPEESTSSSRNYVITEARLKKIRSEFMYWYFDKGGDENVGDYQIDIRNSFSQIHKDFNFELPFFGFRYNYTRVSMNGYLEFSDPPEQYTYPLVFPVKGWPKTNDPAFIGIFFSKCRIGRLKPSDLDQRKPGVYFRLERDLHKRTDQFGVEMRERVMWDIREGVVGADSFYPKHAVLVTWKNMSFAGGIDNALFRTNTFQLVLATDEVYTYAIFNYLDISWTSHAEAGGDPTCGEGGVPAYIGFNAGNGTQSYEYRPYSQASTVKDLSSRGCANGFPGRHIFRIDEKIMLGTCNKDIGELKNK